MPLTQRLSCFELTSAFLFLGWDLPFRWWTLLEIRLTRSARHVIPLNTSGREMLEPMLLMNGNDLLIAIGFFNLTPSLQMVLEYANQHKTPVILSDRHAWPTWWVTRPM